MEAHKPPISCYIRTLNEERRIGEVISAAQALCQEVVCIDSGSTDRTCEIARSLGAKVIHQPWLGNGRQKRVGEDACQQPWLLDLDADEVLSETLTDSIRQLFADGPPRHDIYRLRLTTVDPTGRIWTNIGVALRAKLYRRETIRMPDHGAWDQLNIPASTDVGVLDGPLLHYLFRDIGQLTVKQNAAMSRRILELKPRPFHLLCLRIFLGMPLYFMKKYFLQGLWKAGVYGFATSVACAYGRWLRDVKDYERQAVVSRQPEKAAGVGEPEPATRRPEQAA